MDSLEPRCSPASHSRNRLQNLRSERSSVGWPLPSRVVVGENLDGRATVASISHMSRVLNVLLLGNLTNHHPSSDSPHEHGATTHEHHRPELQPHEDIGPGRQERVAKARLDPLKVQEDHTRDEERKTRGTEGATQGSALNC